MTRDEQRAALIEAIEKALDDRLSNYIPEWRSTDAAEEKSLIVATAEQFLNALHDIARVNPIEATEEMLDAGLMEYRLTHTLSKTWRGMSTIGDLTNAPEGET